RVYPAPDRMCGLHRRVWLARASLISRNQSDDHAGFSDVFQREIQKTVGSRLDIPNASQSFEYVLAVRFASVLHHHTNKLLLRQRSDEEVVLPAGKLISAIEF